MAAAVLMDGIPARRAWRKIQPIFVFGGFKL